jgi:N-carbamoylputrescine amidase
MKQLTLAAAQITCRNGDVYANLEHAFALARQAHEKGVQLLLFPEFMPQGYRLTAELWDAGEPFDGPTTRWLSETARTLGMYIGTSFLEASGGHFFNTFALADPSGKIAGAVCKRNPSMWEAYFFKGKRGAQYIDTDLGRIGVGICFDNHTHEVASAISESNIDLMLMPHSYCTPTQPTQMTSREDIERLNDLPVRVARMYNEWFGVPVVMCNKSGAWDSPVPDTTLGSPKDFRFSGRSIILDADQTVRGELGDEEAVLVGSVTLDPELKKQTLPPKYSRYIYPGPLGREIIRLMEWRGSLYYAFNKSRNDKAAQFTNGNKSFQHLAR